MAMGRPKAMLVLDSELREQLESLANSRSLPAGLVRRSKIILLSASGKTNREIARQLETSDDDSFPSQMNALRCIFDFEFYFFLRTTRTTALVLFRIWKTCPSPAAISTSQAAG